MPHYRAKIIRKATWLEWKVSRSLFLWRTPQMNHFDKNALYKRNMLLLDRGAPQAKGPSGRRARERAPSLSLSLRNNNLLHFCVHLPGTYNYTPCKNAFWNRDLSSHIKYGLPTHALAFAVRRYLFGKFADIRARFSNSFRAVSLLSVKAVFHTLMGLRYVVFLPSCSLGPGFTEVQHLAKRPTIA